MGGYHLKSKKEKSKLLNEYCRVTGQNRDYAIRKLRRGLWVYQERRKKSGKQRIRKITYDQDVISVLIKFFKIFDYPCGQRLAPLLREELNRLVQKGEIVCSLKIEEKLKKISARTIDTKLKPYKEKEKLKRHYD